MSVGKLATALTVVFLVSLLILAAELLYVLYSRRQSSHNHISSHPHSSTKSLLHLFCFKTQARVEPSGAPTQNPDGSSPDDAVIDVFKLLEATGPSRVLCTIKEDDREDVESVELAAAEPERVSLQECLESEAAPVVEDAKTVFSSPCDSPMFYTPVGSPARDGMWSEIISPVKSGCGGYTHVCKA